MRKLLHMTFRGYIEYINENILNEKLFNINDDVDYIVSESGIEEFYNEIRAGKRPFYDDMINDREIAFLSTDSSELKSEEARKAHAINPILIFIGFPNGLIGSHYNALDKYILVSPNRTFFKALYKKEEDSLHKLDKEIFSNEFKIERFKQALAHELSHWISDSLHNSHIQKIIDRANDLNDADYIKLKNKDVNMTYFEVDALIHAIKELKRQYTQEEWDSLTIRDIMLEYTSMQTIDRRLKDNYGLEVALIWQKNILKRMQREGLLGLNMKSYYKDMYQH